MNRSNQQPIGIFDSGIGGLTVAKALQKYLPHERFIYFGDTVHLPYGDKSADAIRYYSIKISKFLMEQNCKLIIIACNSASSAAYDMLLDFFDGKILFVNVVDPLVHAVIDRGFHNIGVIATKATISSSIYSRKIKAIRPESNVVELATPLLAPMIEEGFYNGNISRNIIESYLSHPSLSDIEVLLLACTHYPLIRDEINDFFGGKVTILDSIQVVNKEVKRLLTETGMACTQKSGEDQFFVSDYTQSFENTAKIFYDEDIKLMAVRLWDKE
jgi:glutamate racemase